MAVTLDSGEILASYQTTLVADEVDMLIAVADGADVALDANAVPEQLQRTMKILAVRHMMAMMDESGRGQATSQNAASGAGRTFGAWQGKGLDATRFGSLLKQLDKFGCFTDILDNQDQAYISLRAVGRGAC